MNELKGSKIYVILSIKEGEGFGFLQESCIVSCSLNGHILQTDPCSAKSTVIFDSELIWETDKRTLRSLRLQNVPIKVNVIEVTGKKVGYLMLNLLTATPCPSNKTFTVSHSWHRLLGLNTEAKSSEPKLLLRLTVSDSDKPSKNVDAIQTPRKSLSQPSNFSAEASNYSPVLPTSNASCSNTESEIKLSQENESIVHAKKQLQAVEKKHEESLHNIDVADRVESNDDKETDKSETSHQQERHIASKGNVTFQSHHNTSDRIPTSSDGCEEDDYDHKIRGRSSPDTSFVSEAFSPRDSSHGRSVNIMLHAQGDTPNKHSRKRTGLMLSPQTKEDLIRRTVNALEKWKEKQQLLYTEKIQQSEKLLLQRLEKEWNRKEIERNRVVKECKTLTKALQQAIQDVNERSSQLTLKENKLRLAKDELEMLYMTKYHELNEAARRMEDDYNHQNKLQHLTLTQLETKVKSLEEFNTLYKNKLSFAEAEIEKLKSNTLSKEEISNINQEKICLEKQLEAALKSKKFFKEQWVSAVREANILKLKYSTNVTYSQADPVTYRFQELLQNEESLLRLDSDALRKLKDDIVISERSEPYVGSQFGVKESSPQLDLGSPSKKSVSYKSDTSFI